MNPWISWRADDEATGGLARGYDAAMKRAGKVFNIVRVMSQNPMILDATMGLYMKLMKGRSPLSRAQREMLAALVSRINRCHY